MTPAPTAGRQRGVVLIAVLFMIIVLAGLGIFAVRLGNGQQQSVNLALLGVRAQAAADSGVELGAYSALSAAGCAPLLPLTTVVTVTLTEAALNGFNVSAVCSHSSHTVGAVTYDVYRLDAFAQSGTYGTPAYTARTATRTVSTAH
jgi:Tfp pilus assembly protein PilX